MDQLGTSVMDSRLGQFLVCSRPPPYDCIITPRFPEVLSILAGERESFED
jgi:hypothetical protein